jgi:hypothetical protein
VVNSRTIKGGAQGTEQQILPASGNGPSLPDPAAVFLAPRRIPSQRIILQNRKLMRLFRANQVQAQMTVALGLMESDFSTAAMMTTPAKH